jgi:hypothetical protein
MEAAPAGGQLVPLAEADWPPELRLPAPPPRMDDSQFLGSIMGPAEPETALVLPKRRGRPPKTRDGPPGTALVLPKKRDAAPSKSKEDEGEVVCFICFDGGDLVMCDRRCCLPAKLPPVACEFRSDSVSFCRGCPKVYHPPCIKRDESFFNARTKWNCGELIQCITNSLPCGYERPAADCSLLLLASLQIVRLPAPLS